MGRFTGQGRRRSRWTVVGSAVAVLALVAGCGGGGGGEDFGGTEAPPAKGRQGDVYVAPQVQPGPPVAYAADTAWTAYNNATADANSLYNTYVNTQVLATPTWVDADGTVLLNGDVMEGIDLVSSAPEVVRWRMKPGVTWSDGAPWGCKDFYLAYLAGSGKIPGFAPASTNGYQDIGQARCVDDLTFEATFATPYADYRGLFGQANADLLPAHVLEARTGVPDVRQLTPASPPDVLARVTQFWNTGWNGFDPSVALASGPYMITDFVQNQSITIARNPRWIGNPGGPESITYRNIADATAQAQALQNAEVQVVAPQVDVNAANLLRGLEAQGIRFAATTGSTFEHLDLNFRNPIFQDRAVRAAFAQCVNRQELVDKLVRGVQPDAAPMNSLIYMPNQEPYQDAGYGQIATGNAQQAQQTLAQAGWVTGPDGVATKNGQRLQFRISHTDVPRRVQTVQLIQAQCAPAGMQIVDDTDPNFLDQRVSQGDYDVALFGWVKDPYTSSSQSIYTTGGGQNWQSYSNPQADAVMASAVSDLNPDGYRAKWQEADRIIANDIASIPLFAQPNMVAYADRIDEVFFQPNYGPLYDANEWVVQAN